jgi:hypothetical protein
MLALTRPQRQFAATLAVALGTILPTSLVCWTAWRLSRPAHASLVAQELGRELGLLVEIDSVAYPEPGSILVRGLVIHDDPLEASTTSTKTRPATPPRPATELLRAESARIERSGSLTTLRTDGLRITASGPKQAMSHVTALLQRAGTRPVGSLALIAPTLEVRLGSSLVYSLRDVAGTFTMHGQAPDFQASYRLADAPNIPRCELTLKRDRDSGHPPRTTLAFQNVDHAPLPAAVLDPLFDTATWLGDSASLDGQLVLTQTGAGEWEARFQGSILDLDLAALVQHVAPEQRLNGRARLEIESAHWGPRPGRGPGWLQAQGSLTVPQGGTVGAELLRNLAAQLRFRVPDRAIGNRTTLEYAALGLGFALADDGQIQLTGALPPEHGPEAVLVQPQRPQTLALAPEGIATVAGLVRSLAADQGHDPQHSIPAGFHSLMIQQSLPASARAN